MTENKQVFSISAVPTFRDIHGRFAKASEQLLQGHRELMRSQAPRFVMLAREEAPKRSGEFADNIRYRTFVEENAVGFSVTTPQPLGKWIVKGTRPHMIRAKNAGSLRFNWSKGPKGPGVYFMKSVRHPGTKKNPFVSRAYRRWLPGARADFDRVSTNFVRTLAGARQETL
jgi:hypothetical protein